MTHLRVMPNGLPQRVEELEQKVELLEARADLAKLRLDLTAAWIGFAKAWFIAIYDWATSKVWWWNRTELDGGWTQPIATAARNETETQLSKMGRDPEP